MSGSNDKAKLHNKLLAALSESEYQRLAPDLKQISLLSGEILYEAKEPIKLVYFPVSAMISDVYIMENGLTTEVALVGNEGMVGLPVFWGGNSSVSTIQAQVSGSAIALDASVFKSECSRHGNLTKLLLLYTQAMFTQISLNVACNSHHAIEQRLARWLLSVQDSVQQEDIELTQEFIAYMLGVRRAGVSVAAGILQDKGIISYVRGHITICDRHALEATACECYDIIKQDYLRLLGVFQN
ncbi:MAG: Crp/Fnr family transcriptional regulator [Rivularia sp. (in: cyanobacteria)]